MKYYIPTMAICVMIFTLSLMSCGGSLYDDPNELPSEKEGSFVAVDATAYTGWTYVNLATKEIVIVKEYEEGNTDTPPEEWHIALHRFNIKTDGGKAMETGFGSIESFLDSGKIPSGEFREDEFTTDQVIVDMSGMMDGVIVYAESYINTILGKWITSVGMPPERTLSNKVYIVQMKDGTFGALLFTDYMTSSLGTGCITFDYAYPVEF